MVADPCTRTRESIADHLLRHLETPARILQASDGIEAMEAPRESGVSVDIAILAEHMARLDGKQLLLRIQLHRPTIEVIMLTTEDDSKLLKLGARAALQKPVDLDELLDRTHLSISRVQHLIADRNYAKSEAKIRKKILSEHFSPEEIKQIQDAPPPPSLLGFRDMQHLIDSYMLQQYHTWNGNIPQIAKRIGKSETFTRKHIDRILNK